MCCYITLWYMVHAFDTFVNNGGQQFYSDCTILSIGALRVILELLLLWFRFVANFLYLSVITHWYCYFIFHFFIFRSLAIFFDRCPVAFDVRIRCRFWCPANSMRTYCQVAFDVVWHSAAWNLEVTFSNYITHNRVEPVFSSEVSWHRSMHICCFP